MVKVKTIRRLYHLNRTDFALAIVAVLGVLTFEALEGLLIAVILSLLALVWRASQAKLSVLGREPDRLIFSDIHQHPENRTIPGLLILRPDEGLFFANAGALHKEIIDHIEGTQPPIKVVLLDLEMSYHLDVPSVDMLAELKAELEQRSVELWLARLHEPVYDALDRSGVLQKIGKENVRIRVLEGIVSYLLSVTQEGQEDLTIVRDGLKMTLEVVDKLLYSEAGERREALESYHQRLAEVLRAIESYSNKL